MNHERRSSYVGGALTTRIRMREEKVTMHHPCVVGLDLTTVSNHAAFDTSSSQAGNDTLSCEEGRRAPLLLVGHSEACLLPALAPPPPATKGAPLLEEVEHRSTGSRGDQHRHTTSTSCSELKTNTLRARHANIVRQALQLSNNDCLDSSTITTPKKKKKIALLTRGRGETTGDQHDENPFITGDKKDNVAHAFHLSALASALPLYDLRDELWQSELSYLFGPMGPAFGGRGELTKTNGRKRDLSLLPDTCTENLCQQRSMSAPCTTGLVSVGQEMASFSSTIMSSSPHQVLPRTIQGETRHCYNQEPQEEAVQVTVSIDVPVPFDPTNESSVLVRIPLKRQRQRQTGRISPTSSNIPVGAGGLRRASINFNDLSSL